MGRLGVSRGDLWFSGGDYGAGLRALIGKPMRRGSEVEVSRSPGAGRTRR